MTVTEWEKENEVGIQESYWREHRGNWRWDRVTRSHRCDECGRHSLDEVSGHTDNCSWKEVGLGKLKCQH